MCRVRHALWPPFGGVSVLVNKKFVSSSKIVCATDRYVIVNVGQCLFVNLYLPCVGTADRLSVIEEKFIEVSDWILKCNGYVIVVGGDFNCDLDKSNSASDLINTFVKDNCLFRCDQLQESINKQPTFYNDLQGVQSTINFFLGK